LNGVTKYLRNYKLDLCVLKFDNLNGVTKYFTNYKLDLCVLKFEFDNFSIYYYGNKRGGKNFFLNFPAL